MYNHTAPSRPITSPENSENPFYSHPSIAKIKGKQFLRKSKAKDQESTYYKPLREQASNVPSVTIDLSHRNHSPSIAHLDKCKSELSLQKSILLRQLGAKEEKVCKLKETYRQMQTSRSGRDWHP